MKENKIKFHITKITETLSYIILTILFIFNFFSVFISGIWLVILGQWYLIGVGMLMAFIMPYSFSILLLPSMFISMPLMIYATEKKHKILLYITGFINMVYSNSLIMIWIVFVFHFFMTEGANISYIPLLIWIYSIIMSPLAYMAKSEPSDAVGTNLGLFFAQFGFVLLAITWFIGTNIGYVILLFLLIPFSLIPLCFINKEI